MIHGLCLKSLCSTICVAQVSPVLIHFTQTKRIYLYIRRKLRLVGVRKRWRTLFFWTTINFVREQLGYIFDCWPKDSFITHDKKEHFAAKWNIWILSFNQYIISLCESISLGTTRWQSWSFFQNIQSTPKMHLFSQMLKPCFWYHSFKMLSNWNKLKISIFLRVIQTWRMDSNYQKLSSILRDPGPEW